MTHKKRSLKLQLALGIGLLALISALIMSYLASRLSQHQIELDQSVFLQNIAVRMTSQLAHDMSSRGNEILFLSGSDRIRDRHFPLEKKRQLLERMRQSYPFYAWIGIADEKGDIVVGTDGLLVGKSVAQREWFLKGREGLHFGDAHDAFLLAKLLPKPTWDDLPLRLVDVSAPIRDEAGKLIGVICGHLSLDWAFEARELMLDQLPQEKIDLIVLNKEGKVLMGTPKLPSLKVDLSTLKTYQGLAKNLQVVGVDTWPDGQHYLTAAARETPFRNYPGMGWIVIAREADSTAFAAARHISIALLLTGIVLASAFVGVLWLVLSRKLKPLEEISSAAEQIRRNGANIRIPHLTGSDEVAIFAQSLTGLVNELQENNEALRLASRVFEESGQGILISDANNQILRVNRSFSRITGYLQSEVTGKTPAVLSSGQHDAAFYQSLWATLRREGSWQGEIWNRTKSGHIYPEWLTINTLKDSNGVITHYIAIFDDMSEKKEYENRLIHLATYDQLTGLPNRSQMRMRVESMLADAGRNGTSVAVMFIDLDKFKHINDTLGHPTGDQVLSEISLRFQSQIDTDQLLSRWGGDEFVLAMPNADETSATQLIGKLASTLQRPFIIEGKHYYINMSTGIALYPLHCDSVDALLRCADTAMYKAKREGSNQFRFYNATMNTGLEQFLRIDNALRHMLEAGGSGLSLNFQPQYDTDGVNIVGAEALLRWNHAELGPISPAQFIPVAEETRQIAQLGRWVIQEAARAYAELREHGCRAIPISINCSAHQLTDGSLVATLNQECARHQMPPEHMVIEVTESAIVTNEQGSLDTLVKLREAGHHISIDDFGTGYSCLTYIQKIRPSEIKVDQSFIDKMLVEDDSRNIVSFTIKLAQSMNMVVVAEGVELPEQMHLLKEMSSHVRLQGYLLGRPLPLKELRDKLKA